MVTLSPQKHLKRLDKHHTPLIVVSAQLYPLKSVTDVPNILTHNVFAIKMT